MHHVTSCKAMYIRKVLAHLVVTCHLHFWQNDRGLLRATASTYFSCFTFWGGAWGGGGGGKLAALQNKVVWEKKEKRAEISEKV